MRGLQRAEIAPAHNGSAMLDRSLSADEKKQADEILSLLSSIANANEARALRMLFITTPPKVINATLLIPADDGYWTALHTAAIVLTGEEFFAFIEKISPEAINNALPKQTDRGFTALHTAARNVSAKAFIALIEKASPAVINTALSKRASVGSTPLHSAAYSQSAEAFMALTEKASSEAIWSALVLDAFSGQDTKRTAFIALLEKLSTEAAQALVRKIKNQITAQLKKEKFLSRPENVSRLLRIAEQHPQKSAAILEILNPSNLYPRHNLAIQLRWDHLNRQNHYKIPFLSSVIDFASEEARITGDYAINQLADENRLLIKNIPAEHWPEFIKMMADYGYRPPLRDGKTKGTGTHKFVHLTGKIISIVEQRRTPDNQQTACKKTSATLVKKNLNTPVFGSHDSRPLVGVLMDWRYCEHRALLLKDQGTYFRKWVGCEADAEFYSHCVRDINCTDVKTFVDGVNQPQAGVNELLVKIKREAIQGIFVSSREPEHLAIAFQRQQEWAAIFDLKLPIYYYDFRRGKITALNVLMQLVMQSLIPRLSNLQQSLVSASWRPGFFDKQTYNIDGGKITLTSAAKEVLNLIAGFKLKVEGAADPLMIEQAALLLKRLEELLFAKARNSSGHKGEYTRLVKILAA